MSDTGTTTETPPEAPRAAPRDAALYPPRPIEDALSDETKRSLVAQGYAEGTGADWHPTVDGVVPGYTMPGDTPAAGSLAGLNAQALVALLADEPARADEVEAVELQRAEDDRRKTVLEAIDRARGAA